MKTPTCFECGREMEQTGRLTWYCVDCNVCPICDCPQVDGFLHYSGCINAESFNDTYEGNEAE